MALDALVHSLSLVLVEERQVLVASNIPSLEQMWFVVGNPSLVPLSAVLVAVEVDMKRVLVQVACSLWPERVPRNLKDIVVLMSDAKALR